MLPTTSVIIPAHNASRFITEAVDSALNQTVPPKEIIVINDGSTDDTAEMLAPYVAQKRIILLTQAKAGAAAARNHGLLAATGEIVAFLDADDRWLPNKLAAQLPLYADPAVGLVYSDMRFFGNQNGLYRERLRRGYYSGSIVKELLRENFIPTSSVLLRRSLLSGSLQFRENPDQLAIGEDYELWLRLSLTTHVAYIPDPLVEYRVHAEQVSAHRCQTYRCLHYLFGLLFSDDHFLPYRSLIGVRRLEAAVKKIVYCGLL